MTVLSDFGNDLVARLQSHFAGYAVAYREPLESEIAPKQIWVSVDNFKIEERAATLGTRLNITAWLYVAVFYEVSSTPAHYAAVLAKRQLTAQVLGGAAQAAAVAGLEASVRDESTLLSEGYFMSSTPIELNWEVQSL